MELISIEEAASRGITLLRQPQWASPMSYLKLDIIDGEPGPWTHLHDPMNIRINGRDPVSFMFVQMDYDEKIWIEHTGPTSETPEYQLTQEQMNNG